MSFYSNIYQSGAQCPDYDAACECYSCMLRESMTKAQGLTVSALRIASRARDHAMANIITALQRNGLPIPASAIPWKHCRDYQSACICRRCRVWETWERAQGPEDPARVAAKAQQGYAPTPGPCIDYLNGCSCTPCTDTDARAITNNILHPRRAAARMTQKVILTGTPFKFAWASSQESEDGPEDRPLKNSSYADEKLPPMNCKVCMHRNEYVGKEHLIDGVYVCRSCKPRYRGKK